MSKSVHVQVFCFHALLHATTVVCRLLSCVFIRPLLTTRSCPVPAGGDNHQPVVAQRPPLGFTVCFLLSDSIEMEHVRRTT